MPVVQKVREIEAARKLQQEGRHEKGDGGESSPELLEEGSQKKHVKRAVDPNKDKDQNRILPNVAEEEEPEQP